MNEKMIEKHVKGLWDLSVVRSLQEGHVIECWVILLLVFIIIFI